MKLEVSVYVYAYTHLLGILFHTACRVVIT